MVGCVWGHTIRWQVGLAARRLQLTHIFKTLETARLPWMIQNVCLMSDSTCSRPTCPFSSW